AGSMSSGLSRAGSGSARLAAFPPEGASMENSMLVSEGPSGPRSQGPLRAKHLPLSLPAYKPGEPPSLTRERLLRAVKTFPLPRSERACLEAAIGEFWPREPGEFWPKVKTFADAAGSAAPPGYRHIPALARRGLLTSQERRRRGVQSSNMYGLGAALYAAA